MKFTELLGIFKESKTISKSHMKNLLEMAMVDNQFDDTEFDLLKKLAKKYNVSEKELNKIKEDPDEVQFELPSDSAKKFEQFYELVNMMTIDGNIHREELNLCKLFAKKFGYGNEDELVNVVAQNNQNGLSWEESKTRLDMYHSL